MSMMSVHPHYYLYFISDMSHCEWMNEIMTGVLSQENILRMMSCIFLIGKSKDFNSIKMPILATFTILICPGVNW